MRLSLRISAAAALLLVSAVAAAGPRITTTQKLVNGYARQEPLRSAIFGVLAVRGSDTLAQYNKGLKMLPASNTKLITTGLALGKLGPDYRFKTTLAHTGQIVDGVLQGDLYIVGGGDPTIGSSTSCADTLGLTFSRWKAILDANGIKSVTGRIIGDPRFFKRPYIATGWEFDDLGYGYAAGPAGLNIFENMQVFSVKPGLEGEAPSITVKYPDTPWMSYVNSARTGVKGSGNTITYSVSRFGPYGEFYGSLPVDRKEYVHEGTNTFSAYTCAYFFYNYLISNDIIVNGGFGDISPSGNVRTDLLFSDVGSPAAAPGELKALGSAESPELWRIARDTNHISDNFYAETLFNMLSDSMFGSSDRDSSVIAEYALLKGMGLKTDGSCKLCDGSGLSRQNYVSPEFFVRFLKKMYAGPVRDYYLETLPSPGVEKSTMNNRLENEEASLKSRVKMKSGSMGGVLCFSGYILPADGDRSKTIVFSLLTNNVSAPSSEVGKILESIIVSLAREE